MTQSTLAFPSKRAPQAGSPLRLALELNPDGALVCTGDTAPLKDYLLKPHGFGWDSASGRWRRPGPGGRDAAHRLAAQMQADGQAELTLLDHDPQLPKHSLAAELAQLLPCSAASPAGSQGAAPPSCGGQSAPSSAPATPARKTAGPSYFEGEDDAYAAALDSAMATAGGGGGGGGGGARGAVVPAPLCAQHGLPCAFNTTRKPGTVDASSALCGVSASIRLEHHHSWRVHVGV